MSRGATSMLAASLLFASPGAVAQDAGAPAAKAPPAYRVETIPIPTELLPEIGAIGFARDGALWVGSRRGIVWKVDLADRKPDGSWNAGAWRVFAEGLHEVTGLVDGDRPGELLVCDRPSLVRVRDTDGDGTADDYESLSEEWGLSGNYHEYTFGPVRAPDGGFWVGLGCASDGAGIYDITRGPVSKFGRVGRMYSAVPWRGWVVHVAEDGWATTPFAKGFREPNGMAASPAGELFVTDNQGDWLGTSALYHVEQDGFYGHPSSLVWDPAFTGDPLAVPVPTLAAMRRWPAIQFPHNRCCNSPTQPVFDTSGGKFGPFGGQMILGDIPQGRLLRIALEKVDGAYQGAVIPFIGEGDGSGLRAGSNRLAFAPDGASLYVGQGARGWAEGEGLQRVVPTGHLPVEILTMRVTTAGFVLAFTRPLDRAAATDVARWSVQHYHYHYHRPYGSPEVGVTVVPVQSAELSADGRVVTLDLGGLVAGEVYELHVRDLASADGEPVAHPVAWYTLQRLPPDVPPGGKR